MTTETIINDDTSLKDFLVEFLEQKKTADINVVKLDLDTPPVEYFIFATGKSKKHIESTAKLVALELKQKFNYYTNIEGIGDVRGWVLVDAGGVVLHLFLPEARAYYDLEHLWQKKQK